MKSNWKEERLGSLVRFSSGGTPNKNNPDYWNGTIPWISAKNMKSEVIETSDLSITEEGLIHGSKIAPKGSLLLLVRGSGLFNGIPVCYLENAVAYNQDVKCIESTSELENKYLFYWLKANSGYLRKKIEFTSIGAGKFDTRFLSNLVVRFPDIVTRKKIIDMADNISDRININKKINENLQEQAKAIFSKMIIEEADESWAPGVLSDIAIVTMGQSPKGDTYNEDGVGTVFFQGRAEFGFRFPTQRLSTTDPKRMARVNDALMSVRAPVGDMNVAYEDCCIGRGLAAIHSKDGHQSFVLYTMFNLREELNVFNGEGTVFGSINRDALNSMPISIPPKKVRDKFEAVVSPMDAAIRNNYDEICRLEVIRDSLLPRLMSGELDVSELNL